LDAYLIEKVDELSKGKHIYLIFRGYHNGMYGSYVPSEGFFRSIRFKKDDIEVCIEHFDGNQFNVHTRNLVTGDHFGWSNPTDLTKLNELLEMVK
jgi:hypothetical protein